MCSVVFLDKFANIVTGEENFVRRVEDETKEEKLFFALFFTFDTQ